MRPSLLVLAAGLGSRYGGLKQLDGLGPNGETIMDYSIYDAVKAGFGKVVFVIRKSFENEFREKVAKKYEHLIPIEIVFQELDDLPEGFELNPERVKPWGTNHALLMGKKVINEPFAVINADDFYGRDSYQVMCDYLTQLKDSKNQYCMIGYRVGNTLSESGSVARGVCETDANKNLTGIVERTQIKRIDGTVKFKDENDEWISIPDDKPVSMNMFGFTPDYFKYSDEFFVRFLKESANDLKTEFFIPTLVNELIVNDKVTLKVLDTTSQWFGVTYQEDRQWVVDKFKELVEKGEYPSPLF
ncbi:MAG TPA: sugar phosphate nucleotidyltransferase [Chitinophagales bacterium]|nr:sugar phosphate nucleotidyltransferase [Chitinophagales bacterium]